MRLRTLANSIANSAVIRSPKKNFFLQTNALVALEGVPKGRIEWGCISYGPDTWKRELLSVKDRLPSVIAVPIHVE